MKLITSPAGKKVLVAVTSVLFGCAFSGAHAAQTVVAAQSEIAFTSRQMGVPVDGRFRRFDAQIVFDPKAPERAKVALTIDLASASLGAPETDAELLKPEWFDTKAFPKATFLSTAVNSAGEGKFNVLGRLSIKSSSRDVIVPITLEHTGDKTIARGKLQLNRLDYRIGDGEWKDTSIVANAVEVNIKLVLTGVGSP